LVFFDALRVKIRDDVLVRNKAIHLAPACAPTAPRNPGALAGRKFWLRVMNELKNRGIEDVLIAVVDGLTASPRRSPSCSRRRRCRPASSTCCATASILCPNGAAACLDQLSGSGTGVFVPALAMAGCASPTSSAGHALAGAKSNPKLTFDPDDLVGTGQHNSCSSPDSLDPAAETPAARCKARELQTKIFGTYFIDLH
jgi:hypothetical protein